MLGVNSPVSSKLTDQSLLWQLSDERTDPTSPRQMLKMFDPRPGKQLRHKVNFYYSVQKQNHGYSKHMHFPERKNEYMKATILDCLKWDKLTLN